MGLPPIISLLTETLPILRSGRLAAEEFCADEEAFTFGVGRVL
jgi:hypothetical protein